MCVSALCPMSLFASLEFRHPSYIPALSLFAQHVSLVNFVEHFKLSLITTCDFLFLRSLSVASLHRLPVRRQQSPWPPQRFFLLLLFLLSPDPLLSRSRAAHASPRRQEHLGLSRDQETKCEGRLWERVRERGRETGARSNHQGDNIDFV